MGLPDVGDPFDVAAFERPIPDEINAFILYKQAAAILPKEPEDPPLDWNQASPARRRWLESGQEALEIWRRGTDRPDALNVPPGVLTFETRMDAVQKLRSLGRLAWLQGSRLEAEGDVEGALDWHLSLLRSSRHCGQRGTFIDRLIGIGMHRWASDHLIRWAADPKVDARMLRRALDAALAAGAATPPTSDGLKAEYLSFLHSIDDPELMLRIHDSFTTPTPAGGSVTNYGATAGWRSSLTRVRRRALNEPARSRRVVRLVFANWLAYCDRPPGQRPPRVVPNPKLPLESRSRALLADLYAIDATAPGPARALPPQKLANWYGSTIDALMALTYFDALERAIARERSLQGNLLVALASGLHLREHGEYPGTVEDLVGPYLKALPDGYKSLERDPQP